jgi:hypothetical protein
MTDSEADGPNDRATESQRADRETELRELAARARKFDAVEDAFLAKSFTDRLLVVDLNAADRTVPDELVSLLEAYGCRGANEVYGRDGETRSSTGAFGGATRHQFVDTETRGEHQSYVVE